MSKPSIEVTGFWMRNSHKDGSVEFLVHRAGRHPAKEIP